MSVKITIDKTGDFLKALEQLQKERVLVGIPADSADRKVADDAAGAAPSNALIGYVQEFGDPEHNIPARPFLSPGVESVEDRIASLYASGAKAVLDGKVTSARDVHERVGMAAANAVKRKMTEGPFTPLSDSTLEARARRGGGSRRGGGRKGAAAELASRAAGNEAGTDLARPLIDTGQLRNAITYVVRPAKNQGG